MIYINSFIVVGIICLIAQILLDNTKLTPGHITSLFVITGAFLSFLGIYDAISSYSKVGSSIPITSFGNALYQASYAGFQENGLIGMFSNLLSSTSAGISGSIFFGFIISLIFKIRD